VEELRQSLKNKLPDYMLPAAIASIKQWPVGPNGKLDKGSLPAPEKNRSHVDQSYVAPRTPTEKMLAAIWGEVLGMDQVGVHDNFFHFGGHSLLATLLVSRVREAFQVELPLERLFEEPTVAALSVAIVQSQAQQFEIYGMEEILRAVEELPEVEAESLLSDRNEWAADLKTT
jgi:acyl carrier protein